MNFFFGQITFSSTRKFKVPKIKNKNPKPKMVKRQNTDTGRLLRNNNDLAIPVINSQFGRRSVIYNGPKVWNDMPETIRSLPSISSFKSNTKKHLLLKEKNTDG